MPPKPRVEFTRAIYDLMSRGDQREDVFLFRGRPFGRGSSHEKLSFPTFFFFIVSLRLLPEKSVLLGQSGVVISFVSSDCLPGGISVWLAGKGVDARVLASLSLESERDSLFDVTRDHRAEATVLMRWGRNGLACTTPAEIRAFSGASVCR
jgi:hypothetical protein